MAESVRASSTSVATMFDSLDAYSFLFLDRSRDLRPEPHIYDRSLRCTILGIRPEPLNSIRRPAANGGHLGRHDRSPCHHCHRRPCYGVYLDCVLSESGRSPESGGCCSESRSRRKDERTHCKSRWKDDWSRRWSGSDQLSVDGGRSRSHGRSPNPNHATEVPHLLSPWCGWRCSIPTAWLRTGGGTAGAPTRRRGACSPPHGPTAAWDLFCRRRSC
jgi:hypothetical protein